MTSLVISIGLVFLTGISLMPVKSVDAVQLPVLSLPGRAGICSADDLREEALRNISTIVQSTILHVTQYINHPCGPGLWRRVAFLDMTDSNQQCPSNWTLHDTSTSGRSCIRPNTITIGCASTFFSTGSVDYNRVCGRAIGIASGSPDGYTETGNNRGSSTINDPYVDGLSITHGSPRQHILTFVTEPQNRGDTAPPFVGEDYFCDEKGGGNLWDGVNCPTATCCTINTPPWFNRMLPRSSTDDIEVRICLDEGNSNEIVGIQLLEVFTE